MKILLLGGQTWREAEYKPAHGDACHTRLEHIKHRSSEKETNRSINRSPRTRRACARGLERELKGIGATHEES